VDVEVFEGSVTLRGSVPSVIDVENAEEVAARVPGVVEVDEELDVEDLA
jgi:osmotically-inducible protein OsmY